MLAASHSTFWLIRPCSVRHSISQLHSLCSHINGAGLSGEAFYPFAVASKGLRDMIIHPMDGAQAIRAAGLLLQSDHGCGGNFGTVLFRSVDPQNLCVSAPTIFEIADRRCPVTRWFAYRVGRHSFLCHHHHRRVCDPTNMVSGACVTQQTRCADALLFHKQSGSIKAASRQ